MTRMSFDDVLGTNYVPTQDERQLIAKLIESKEHELSSMNDTTAPLHAKRDKLHDDVLAHKALLTPARGLLPELVSEVFIHSVNCITGPSRESDPFNRFAIPSVNEAPLVLGRICRRWRKIALSTPSLWSTISIPESFSVGAVQGWISRAGSCNISFTLQVGRANIEVSNFLASYQLRWREVVLGFVNYYDIEIRQDFLESLSPEYPNLQTLEIHSWAPPSSNIPLVIGSAPKLRELIIRDPSFKFTTLEKSPPLCLRKISVMRVQILSTDLLALLRLCPTVQLIRANVLNTFDSNARHHDILTLPALKRVHIKGHYREHQNFCILERIHVPALEELSFHTPLPSGRNIYTPQIRSLIHRSRPPLKTLCVWGNNFIPSVDIMEILPFLPLLSELGLDQVKGKLDGLINALAGPIPPFDEDLSACICPKLKNIYFKSTYDLPPESVVNMILSRSPNWRSRLAHVIVIPCEEGAVEADPRVIECIANGLKFESEGRWAGWRWLCERRFQG